MGEAVASSVVAHKEANSISTCTDDCYVQRRNSGSTLTFPRRTTRVQRGFSTTLANELLVQAMQNKFLDSLKEGKQSFVDSSQHTFMLPNLEHCSTDYRAFLEKELIELSHLVSLEQSGRLNWWCDLNCSERLWPMSTTGDGNCLLHASSLAMWGVHDRELLLRHALYHYMWDDVHSQEQNTTGNQKSDATSTLSTSSSQPQIKCHTLPRGSTTLKSQQQISRLSPNPALHSAFYRRWRWQTQRENAQLDFILAEEQWATEWDILVKLSTPSPKRITQQQNNNSAQPPTSNTVSQGNHNNGNSAPASVNGSDSSTRQYCTTKSSSSGSPCFFPLAGRRLSSSSGYSDVFDSLEQVHVFALAHILRRPIIVVADTMLCDARGQPLQPIHFGGVYLPLLESPEVCHKDPLLLAYKDAHFSALVPMQKLVRLNNGMNDSTSSSSDGESSSRLGIPLIDPKTLKLLPIHYMVDPGPQWQWNKDCHDKKKVKKLQTDDATCRQLLEKYLNCAYLAVHRRSGAGASSNISLSSNEEFPVPCSTQNGTSSLDSKTAADKPTTNEQGGGAPEKEKKNKTSKKLNSLGKSFGRQLRRALSRPRDCVSGSKSTPLLGSHGKTLPGQSIQSTAYTSVPRDLAELRETGLYVALLNVKLPPNYHEMIENYLSSAEKRFQDYDVQQRRNSREIVRRAQQMNTSNSGEANCGVGGMSRANEQQSLHTEGVSSVVAHSTSSAMPCVRSGCNMFGSVTTENLCSQCYRDSRTVVTETVPSVASDTLVVGSERQYPLFEDTSPSSVRVSGTASRPSHNTSSSGGGDPEVAKSCMRVTLVAAASNRMVSSGQHDTTRDSSPSPHGLILTNGYTVKPSNNDWVPARNSPLLTSPSNAPTAFSRF